MKVYLLEHAYEYGKELRHTEVKTLGIYETKKLAEQAIWQYMKLPGFCDYGEECFFIDEYELNKGEWTEGFFDADGE